MKVLLVRPFPDILNLNTYNVQEIGLAKALAAKGIKLKSMNLRKMEKNLFFEYIGYGVSIFLKMVSCPLSIN